MGNGIAGKDYVEFDVVISYTVKEVLVIQMYILIKYHQIIHKICAFALHKI